MNREEFESLGEIDGEPAKIKGAHLEDQEERLLLRGHNDQMDDFEVHLIGGKLRLTIQNLAYCRNKSEPDDGFEPRDLIPDGETYVEDSDFEFCALLKRRGQSITFP